MWLDEYRRLQGLVAAGKLEALFESLAQTSGTAAQRRQALERDHLRQAALASPNHFIGNPLAAAEAEDLVDKLAALHQRALRAIDQGDELDWRDRAPGGPAPATPVQAPAPTPTATPRFVPASFTVSTERGTYEVTETLARGDLATVYAGRATAGVHDGKPVVVKVAVEVADNDLMLDEVRTLQLLSSVESKQRQHLPQLYDQFQTARGQAGTILSRVEGHDLIAIHERYPDGIPPEHSIWILRRLLSVLGFAHSQGVIHGNVEPSHVIVRPADHNVTLIDWCYSIVAPSRTRQGWKANNPDYSPPEVALRKPPLPSADLYSTGKCIILLLGGDIHSDAMPERVDERLQRMLRFLVRPSAIGRAQDAWELFAEVEKLRHTIWGPHRFIEFVV